MFLRESADIQMRLSQYPFQAVECCRTKMPPSVSHDFWRVIELPNQTQSHTRGEVRDTEIRNILKSTNRVQCGPPYDNRGRRHEIHPIRSQHVARGRAKRIVQKYFLRKSHSFSDRTAQSSFPLPSA